MTTLHKAVRRGVSTSMYLRVIHAFQKLNEQVPGFMVICGLILWYTLVIYAYVKEGTNSSQFF